GVRPGHGSGVPRDDAAVGRSDRAAGDRVSLELREMDHRGTEDTENSTENSTENNKLFVVSSASLCVLCGENGRRATIPAFTHTRYPTTFRPGRTAGDRRRARMSLTIRSPCPRAFSMNSRFASLPLAITPAR